MIEEWINEIKRDCDPGMLGMILTHTGVVRGTAKDGKRIRSMRLSYNKELLKHAIDTFKQRTGIAGVKVWVNEGDLQIGDTIMKVCVAGRFRTDVLPVFQDLISLIKTEIVQEKEL